ncbi:uncharacterized protein LOC141715234 [Apium graveolens]|uniref:uncharacterized protein LOC141715234 n=1 Tax=Apium graveolens TaxID=4045 RepID=UPI003D79B0F7
MGNKWLRPGGATPVNKTKEKESDKSSTVRLTGFYGEPNRNQRKRTWELLRNLSRDSNLPWCVIGDINNIASQTDKRGGALYPQWLLDGFNDTLEETGLNDIDLIGHPFSWERGRDIPSWIEIRLDRALVMTSWLELYPYAKLYNLEGSPLTTSAVILEPMCRDSGLRKKRFKFENVWLKEPLCSIIIRNSWEAGNHRDVQYKIQSCADTLGVWGKKITRCFNRRIRDCHQKLKELRKKRDAQLVEYREVVNCVTRAISQDQNLELTREVTSEEGLLDNVVSATQSALIPNRLISDNIMLAYELMHYLKGKKVGKDGYTTLKLDMSKAYDRVEWEFLKVIFFKIGFSPWWVHLVLQCVTTVVYSIVHGEHELGPIHPMRGICQGIHCPPIYSSFVLKASHHYMRNYETNQRIHGVKICRRAPIINNMLFADDSYLFCKADSEEASTILELTETYEKASGQQVNKGKSSIFYSKNVFPYNRQAICQLLQMIEANEYSTYLGLLNVISSFKSALLGYLKDKVNMKIRSWEGNYISRSGKEILVKHVAQTFSSYAMSVFLLPLEITRNIEKNMTRFWWNSSQYDKSKLSWMSWDRLSKHKHAGGMSFRHFRYFNIAMLGKQVWRLATNPNSLVSRVYKAKYFATSDILHANLGHNLSFIWRSLLEEKNLLVDVVKAVLNDKDQVQVLAIPLTELNDEDKLFWRLEDTGIYSVKSAYGFLQAQKGNWSEEENDKIWQILWRIKAPPKTLNLVWIALSDCLPTLSHLQQKRVPVQSICPVCQQEVESILHNLVSCQFTQHCWLKVLPNFSYQGVTYFRTWLSRVLNIVDTRKHAEIITLCWSLWRSRKDLVWKQKTTTINKTVAATMQYLAQWRVIQDRSFVTPLQPLIAGDGASTWVKPQPNTVKVSVDAAVFKDRDGIGFGLVARNCKGELIEAKAVFQAGV